MDGSTLKIGKKGTPVASLKASSPRLTILYHGDPNRVGDATAPDVLGGGDWVVVGRLKPGFVSLARPGADPLGIRDPYLSRQQAAIRWRPRRGCFEVRPAESAQLPTCVVDLNTGLHRPIVGPETLPPGSLLAIGERVLLLLSLAVWHGPEVDRMGMVGESPAVWGLREDIAVVSRFDRPALILGETGAGKELVARALHESSPQAGGPFIPVNCAALPEHLVESLLFGHRKGAFTGAAVDSGGLFQDANGGTLFLDELGELPMGLQAKILRVIQEREYTPVGARQSIKTTARIVSATNRDPEVEIRDGRLRSDLYYRVAAHTITVPPLGDKRWDVPQLFAHFLSEARQNLPELGKFWPDPLPEVLPLPMSFVVDLMRHRWPGNTRQLQNVTEQLARHNLTPGPFTPPPLQIERSPTAQAELPRPPEPLPAAIIKRASRVFGLKPKTLHRLLNQGAPVTLEPNESNDEVLERLKDILAANFFEILEESGFNQVQVAEVLGVARSTLIRLMARFGLPRPQDLSTEAIESAYAESHGDIAAMARLLRVSPAGLKMRLRREGRTDWLES